MTRATVSHLKATLSQHLARVKAGEEVLVTERGKPIARIVPWKRKLSGVDPRLMELTRAGLIHLGTGKLPAHFWRLEQPKDRNGAVWKALLQERNEGR